MLVFGQQLVLALVLLATMLFVKLSRRPDWWNPILPHEEPVFLFIFIFLFFFTTPMLALGVLFGGRYFRSWRRTIPATLVILALSVLGTYLVVRTNLHKPNPVQRRSSINQFAIERGLSLTSYRDWVGANWLMNDPRFQRDYEAYLRKGPGRWITSNFKTDAAWGDSLRVMNEYLDGGQDPESFKEWLTDYLDRNKIYSEDRVGQEVSAIMGDANQRFLGIWQVEPYLRERDERMYRAYLGGINAGMKRWGLFNLLLFTMVFLIIYLTGPALSAWERMSGRVRVRPRGGQQGSYEAEAGDPRGMSNPSRVSQLKDRYYSFPERREITTLPFFDTPFKLLSNVHRSFVRVAVFTSIFVFAFWMAVYALDLAAGRENAPSQLDLMRSHLLFGGPADREENALAAQSSADAAGQSSPAGLTGRAFYSPEGGSLDPTTLRAADGSLLVGGAPNLSREALLALRVSELERRLDEGEYDSRKQAKQQNQIIASQRQEIDLLRSLSSQLQEATSALPGQVSELSSRAIAAEARAGEVLGEVSTTKQQAENIEKQISTKLGEVEARAQRATDQIGRVEDQASVLATRTEALEKELDRRARQVEARTEELGERTAGIKEREERFDRLQRIAFTAILSTLKADVDDLERRVGSAFYRMFSKGEAQRDVDGLRQRIDQLAKELRDTNTEQAKELINQLEELSRRVEQISTRVR